MATHNVISGGKDSTPTLLDAIAQNAFCLLASICQIDNAKTPSREIPCDLVVSMDAMDCSSAYIIYNSYLNSAATREVA
jgi:diphthamide synthase (EF-2-diphthine--ammonia ligase)